MSQICGDRWRPHRLRLRHGPARLNPKPEDMSYCFDEALIFTRLLSLLATGYEHPVALAIAPMMYRE